MNASKESDSTSIYQWEKGWDGHEQMQLMRLARLPLSAKLKWLEEAHRIVMQLSATQSSHSDDPLSRKQ